MILRVDGLRAGYGDVPVLWDVSLALEPGQTTCVVGANGAAKTTLLRAIMGQIPVRSGSIMLQGRDITDEPVHRRTAQGLVLVPEGRQLFTNLTVQENLDMGATPQAARSARARNLERVVALFPLLGQRRRQIAGTLSGGEQQMLAIGRGLMSSPTVLMLDEPSMGLEPLVVISLYQAIRQLKDADLTILLVEQSLHLALAVSHWAYVLSEGRVVLSGEAAELRGRPEVGQAYLGRRIF